MKKLALLVSAFVVSNALAQTPSGGWGSAVWIWDEPDANQVAQSNEPRYLRRTFELPGNATKAELWITADNRYIAYLNGQKVGADDEWKTLEKIDVAKFLVPGKNVLAIETRNEGGQAGVIARLHVQAADKKELLVGTDQQTRITRSPEKDWLKLSFDDSRWQAAIVLGDPGIGPWNIVSSAAPAGKSYDVSAVDPKIKTRLSAQEQRKHFVVPDGFEVELVADDPLVINPITMAMDDKGRIYVSESHTYRYGPPGSPIKPFANPVIRLDPVGKSFKRTLVADGFDDPVMGIAIKGDKIWLTANNFLYQYDLPEDGKAINKKMLLVDKSKAWNPFGMFILEWGMDGRLYMSVGNHAIDIHGPDGKISGRGGSGIVVRMNPDGTRMERLVHGLRVPYSFEQDPFGQLWVLSNGEGNPNRFVRVIEGVDYHCYSRGNVDNNWLAGNHPLAPPSFELVRGAHTQLLRYYGAAFPAQYQGNLFLCNWGAHGFSGPNRAIFRFVPDERGNITSKESLLSCTDPHFRPSYEMLDPDGNLLIADWYGRDDESDMTGRIWRLKYVGKDRPVVKHKFDSDEWKSDEYAISALGSPHHLIREKALNELVERGKKQDSLLLNLAVAAKKSEEPLQAANALWALMGIDLPESKALVVHGFGNSDWRVRCLAYNLVRRYQISHLADKTKALLRNEKDPAVCIEGALTLDSAEDVRSFLFEALERGAATDLHLRYQAAWHLARVADSETFATLLVSDDESLRLAGMIAVDVACYENYPSKPAALASLRKAIESPGKADLSLLLALAQLDGDASIVPALEKLVMRDDVPPALTAKALIVLKAKAGGFSKTIGAAAGKRLIDAVEKGTVRITAPADQLLLFEFLESQGPTDFALKQIAGQIQSGHPSVRPAAHALARRFGVKAEPLVTSLWPGVLDPRIKSEDAVEHLSTLARIEATPRQEAWEKMLEHPDPLVRTDAVRWWRAFKGRPELTDVLIKKVPDLVKRSPELQDDLNVVRMHLEGKKAPPREKEALTKSTLAALSALTPAEKQKRALLGQQVFERADCTKCHTTAMQTTLLAPSLKGSAGLKLDYLIESLLYPSKIIKTGFESETIVTTDGKVLNGLVKDEGKTIRVLNLDKDVRVAKSDIEQRSIQRVSIMPEGQEAQLSRREFTDLIAYLSTLK